MSDLAVTPLEKVEAVTDWVRDGIPTALSEDPSGFLLGVESVSVLEALADIAAYIRQVSR